MTPLERYEQERLRPDFLPDRDQAAAIAKLNTLYHQLCADSSQASHGWRGVLARLTSKRPYRKGFYFWGGVGRGKTFVLDTFCACVPSVLRHRVHFHGFMRDVHAELKQLRGVQDPLQQIAAHWAREFRVLCLDEFHVVDITDAMLIGQLLTALFSHGVTLVTTSNEAPDNLYREGLQRERFMPAIALIKQHLEVIEFAGNTDYRWRTLTQAATYYSPQDDTAEASLARCFSALTHVDACNDSACSLRIEGREIPVCGRADGVVWFTFESLCEGPRSPNDYIEIGCCFHTVLISGVPIFTEEHNDAARRFINLVDELYDRGVNLLMTAVAPPSVLYQGSRLVAPFRRTASRLVEMQTQEYLAKPHLNKGSKLYKTNI